MAPRKTPSLRAHSPVPVNSAGLQALIRLSSASLPIGGYSYSQGLESAVAHGRVNGLVELGQWLSSSLTIWPKADALLWALSYQTLVDGRPDQLGRFNEIHWASRDSAELRTEAEQMGWSLVRLLVDLGWVDGSLQKQLSALDHPTFLIAHASACWSRGIDLKTGLVSFCFAFIESQVQAAQKLLPIGQAAAQRLLCEMQPRIDLCIEETLEALVQGESTLHTSAPLHAILCARHEFQYSRLFRS
ncbi:MAG: Urease accessory protein [Pseudomonadota bacterium]